MEEYTPLKSEHSLGKNSTKRGRGFRRFMRIFLLLILLGVSLLVYFKYFYVFGDGVKSGYLNFAVRKGNVFKTYEGKLIQTGYKVNLQSNEFEFSIKSKRVYDILSVNSGKIFDLHYKEYHGIIPWRGNTRYIVDSIISMRDQ